MNELISRQLKPCPFCGGTAIVDMDEYCYWDWHAWCFNCGCDIGHYATEEEAIEEWNKRAEPPADVPDTNVGEYIKLEDLLAYPIRLNHYDKVNGSIKFVYGVESVLEFAENLDRYAPPPADQWNVISSDEDGVLWNLPEEEVEVLVSYRNHVWIDTLLSDKDGVYFDNYCDCREGMAWKNVEPYKGE